MKELKEFVQKAIAEHPELKSEIIDLYDLCRYEIEDGGSPDHEIELCRESIRQLYEQTENT
jgi:hypothetical protein